MSAEREVKQVIVIRRDLGMRRGKEIAQGAHASLAWLTERLQANHLLLPAQYYLIVMSAQLTEPELRWVSGSFAKIVCQVPGELGLLEVLAEARSAGVLAREITDAGRTEFHGVPTRTAVAVGPDWADAVDQVTGGAGAVLMTVRRMIGRQPPVALKHSNPVTEQRLEHIRQLQRMLELCESQVNSYYEMQQDADLEDGYATGNARDDELTPKQLAAVLSANAARRAVAAAGIDAEHARMSRLQGEITRLMSELDINDLAFL
jgi:PTH2 family peptidyl-tRNA hydrolase